MADQSDPGSGLRAFDIPLVYITADRFNQPIFVCNNLTGAATQRMSSSAPDVPVGDDCVLCHRHMDSCLLRLLPVLMGR